MSNDDDKGRTLAEHLRAAREAAEAVERRVVSRVTARRRASVPNFERPSVTIRRRSVLLIDDDSTLAQALADHLADEGLVVTTASTLDAARQFLSRNTVDVLLIDLSLESEFGSDLIDELARRPDAPPTILISAFALAGIVAQRYDIGHLRKPFDLTELSAAIGRAVERHQRPRLTG